MSMLCYLCGSMNIRLNDYFANMKISSVMKRITKSLPSLRIKAKITFSKKRTKMQLLDVADFLFLLHYAFKTCFCLLKIHKSIGSTYLLNYFNT